MSKATVTKSEPEELVFILWESNWSDEMDVFGFSIVTKEKANLYKKELKKVKRELYISVGTNEEVAYEEGGSEMLEDMTFKKITEEEAKTIKKFFGGRSYGIDIVDVIETILEEAEGE